MQSLPLGTKVKKINYIITNNSVTFVRRNLRNANKILVLGMKILMRLSQLLRGCPVDKKTTILIVDDDKIIRTTLSQILKEEKYIAITKGTGKSALDIIKIINFDIIIVDLKLPDINGLELLKEIKDIIPDIYGIIITAYPEINTAISAPQKHAYDYIIKPFDVDHIKAIIKKCIKNQMLEEENKKVKKMLKIENEYLKREINDKYREIIGKDGDIKEIIEKSREAAKYDTSIFIFGETGTGKELLSRFIHESSPRKNFSFIPVSCSVFSSGILESELFGHEKGAFTGAYSKRKGRFEIADHGTLFLDEIGDISIEMQTKLLRVIEEGEFERVGGNDTIKVDVRFISAANKDISELIMDNKFRSDLYYRLNVIPIILPPLRERKNDIEIFIKYFINIFNKKTGKSIRFISKEANNFIYDYHWPGNIREMSNAFERAVVIAKYNVLNLEDFIILPSNKTGKKIVPPIKKEGKGEKISKITKESIIDILQRNNGNKSKSAKELGISRQHFYRKIKSFNIKNNHFID